MTPARWMVALCGAAACAAGAYEIHTWPDVAGLARHNPETTAFVERYRRQQRVQGQAALVRWTWVPWERISPDLKRAVVAGEDMEFFFHHGFSSAELADALRTALQKLETPRGASTITQQLAKNLWLSPSRNPLRKLKEALLTRQLERHVSKRRILEVYLNVVEFGPGIYGAEAAAQYYFGKPAAELTEYQAAQLAASLPRPATWHPGRESGPYAAYVSEIRRRMTRAGFLWRAVGAMPDSATPAAIELDSIRRVLEEMVPMVADVPNLSDSAGDTLVDRLGDSLLVAQMARQALASQSPGLDPSELLVARWVRDSLGVLIDLVPGPWRDTTAFRGATVRVRNDGTAVVVRIH